MFMADYDHRVRRSPAMFICYREKPSPTGDAAMRAVDSRQASVTGVIAASQSDPGKLVLRDGSTPYTLAGQVKARRFAGLRLCILGISHESTGLLEIRNIDPLPR
ncbi:MAG: hypothetical protein WAJ87_07375 [Bryobacteraceae bacterium]